MIVTRIEQACHKMFLPSFLINLDGSTERLQSATAQLDSAGIAFERVPAFDGRNLTPDQFPDYDAEAAMRHMGRPLNGGEIGAYQSHLRAARRFVESGEPYGIVFEDDLDLEVDFRQTVTTALAWMTRNAGEWDILHLSARKHKLYSVRHTFNIGDYLYQIEHAHYFPMTATSVLWSRTGARLFIDNHRSIIMPVDVFLRHWQARRNRGYSIWPPPAAPSGAASDIDSAAVRRNSIARHPLYGLRVQRRLWTDKAYAIRHKFSAR